MSDGVLHDWRVEHFFAPANQRTVDVEGDSPHLLKCIVEVIRFEFQNSLGEELEVRLHLCEEYLEWNDSAGSGGISNSGHSFTLSN